LLGENVGSYSYADRKKERIVDLKALSSGIYYVSIQTQAGSVTRRVTVNH
ncbi:MAG: hypothetical protein JWO03_2396, partial [Bacteroidetes bacterium]|nr:hypothetical protein [Bacteroidota bacterium]